jgi:hypothetical protein
MSNRMTARKQLKGRNTATDQCMRGMTNAPNIQSATKISGIFGPSAIHTQTTPAQKATNAIAPSILGSIQSETDPEVEPGSAGAI